MDKDIVIKVQGSKNSDTFKEEYDVTITPDGNIQFFLKDGTWYDLDKSGLSFGETDPVRARHQLEASVMVASIRDDYREYFEESDKIRYPWKYMTLKNKRAASKNKSDDNGNKGNETVNGNGDITIIANMKK